MIKMAMCLNGCRGRDVGRNICFWFENSFKAVGRIYWFIIILCIKNTMPNKCKKINKNTKHYFILNGRDDLYFREQVAALFKPYNKTKNRTHTSITPTFNNDRKDYTYSFTIPSVPPENQERLEADHKKRVAESLLENQEILVPKPRSKHKYCGVCRGHYEDYKEHTQGPEHTNCLKRSIYQCMIGQVCRQFQISSPRKDKMEDESKSAEATSQQNPIKLMSYFSQISTPQKVSPARF